MPPPPQPPGADRRAGDGGCAARTDRAGRQPRRAHHRGPARVHPPKVSPQRRAKRTWATTCRSRPGSTSSSRSTTRQRRRCCTSASPRTSGPGCGATSPRPRSAPGWTRWCGSRPASRRCPADPAAGRGHRAAPDRQPRAAIQPALQVPRAHPVDQDHRRGVSPAVGGPGGTRTTMPPTSVRSADGRRPRTWCSRSTTDSRSGSAPRG